MITVIGYDGRQLPDQARAAVAGAGLVVGGARHLKSVGVPPGARTVVMGDVRDAVEQLRAHSAGAGGSGDAVVLASGDPGFFGIVRRLRAANLPVTVVPAVSSVAQAFARVGIEWDDALVVSAHGRDPRAALNACRRFSKVAVLTDAATGPREIAAAVPGRRLVVAERLGEPDERVVELPAEQVAARDRWREPNVVLVLGDEPASEHGRIAGGDVVPRDGWALPDAAFEHRDGMVTKAEVRALVLARLAPRPGALVWDVGAGSGAVGIECARFGAAVCAVERDVDSVQRIFRNASRHGVRLDVISGAAPEALAGLPEPDAIFVGGGGADVVSACAERRSPRLVAALATLDSVTRVTAVMHIAGYQAQSVMLQAARLRPLGDGTGLAAQNPVFVVSGRRS